MKENIKTFESRCFKLTFFKTENKHLTLRTHYFNLIYLNEFKEIYYSEKKNSASLTIAPTPPMTYLQ